VSIFDVRHQPRAHRIIQRALAGRRMPHAYLFAGPEGVGREMLAIRLAHVLLCSSPVQVNWPKELRDDSDNVRPVDACGQCQDCRLAAAGTHPDLSVVHRLLNRQHPDATIRQQKALFLGVEVIRHFLVDRIGTRPARGRAKVFVVRQAERLNEAAQNALLKTLEEPPPGTFIILVTTSLDRMLPTTRSRCQYVPFQRLPTSFVEQRLRELCPDAEPAEAHYAARHADGSVGGAMRCIEDGLYSLKRAWGEQLAVLARPSAGWDAHELADPFLADAGRLAKAVTEHDPEVSDTDANREAACMLLSVLADFFRDALQKSAGGAGEPINADQLGTVDRLAGWGCDSLTAAVRHLAEAESCLARNAHVKLTLETLFIRLARLAGRPTEQAGSRGR